MNARLTPGLLAIALLVLTLYGPLSELRSITTDDMQSRSYWLDMAAASIASFADASIALIGVVATALGIPLISSRFSAKGEGGASSGAADNPPAGG